MRAFGLFVVFSALVGAAAWQLDIEPQDLYAHADFSSLNETVESVQELTGELGASVTEWIASLPPTAALPAGDTGTGRAHNEPAARGVVAGRNLPSYVPGGEGTAATTSPGTAVDSAMDEALEAEAREHVSRLATPVLAPIEAADANHFVTPDQVINLVQRPRTSKRTLASLADDPDSNADTPITIVTRTSRIEDMSAQALVLDAAGDMNSGLRIVDGDNVRDLTLGEALSEMRDSNLRTLRVMRSVAKTETTTLGELRARGITDDMTIEIVDPTDAGPSQVALRDLLPSDVRLDPGSVLYVRTVSTDDEQGLWGVVQQGLMDNFARGVALNRGDRVETYAVDIPRNADEIRPDRHSSFLGRLIYAKTGQSYVYNFHERRMGRNPNDIHPGQEIVIINFSPDELIAIYKHFADQRG